MRSIFQCAGIALFLGALWVPVLGQSLSLDWSPPLEEKRYLASFPGSSYGPIQFGQFPARFDAWFNDHLGFRSSLIRWHNFVLLYVLRSSPARGDVIVGNDGWYFLSNTHIMNYYRRTDPYTEEELAAYCEFLEARRDWCESRGAKFVYAIAPESMTLNAEHFPKGISRLAGESRVDQLGQYMHAHSNVTILDLRGPVSAIKSQHQTHYKLDSHWTEAGALAGWGAVAEALRAWFPDLPIAKFDDYNTEFSDDANSEIPNLIPLPSAMTERVEHLDRKAPGAWLAGNSLRIWENGYFNHSAKFTPEVFCSDHTALPTAMVFGDSFGYNICPFAAESFRKLIYAPQSYIDPLLVEQEKPDVVIWLHTERCLMYLDPNDQQMAIPPSEDIAPSFVLDPNTKLDDTPWILADNHSFEDWNDRGPANWNLEYGLAEKEPAAFVGNAAVSLVADETNRGARVVQTVPIPEDVLQAQIDFRVAYLSDEKNALKLRVQWGADQFEECVAESDGRWHTWQFSRSIGDDKRIKHVEVSFERAPGARGRTLLDDVFLSIKRPPGIHPSELDK